MAGRFYDTFGHERASHDLARANEQIDDFFISTKVSRYFLGGDPPPPFIVGAKGAGKSLLLFKKVLLCRALSGVMVLPRTPEFAFGPTEQFAQAVRESSFWPVMAAESESLETWSTMWQSALLRTIFGGWLRHENQAARTENRDELRQLTSNSDDVDPFEVLLEHLEHLEAQTGTRRGSARLVDLRPQLQFFRRNAERYPPPYLFIDNSDECFTDNPEFWIRSCVGLFRAVQVLRERSGHRIHSFITLRPEVILRLQRNEQFPQWQSDLLLLQWEDEELLRLFTVRARHLRPELLESPDLVGRDPIAALLGSDLIDGTGRAMVQNEAVRVREPVSSYILRHTLRRPRDLIIVGSRILGRKRQRESEGDSHGHIVREAVDGAAGIIGRGYVAEVRQHWPWGTTGETSIEAFIQTLPRNVLTRTDAELLQRRFALRVGRDISEVHPLTKLVSLGLVGFPAPSASGAERVQYFVAAGETSSANVPLSADWYLVHPVLYGEPFHIPAVHGLVVGPGLSFRPSTITELAIESEDSEGRHSNDRRGIAGAAPKKRNRSRRKRLARKGSTETTIVFRWVHLSDLHFGAGTVDHRFDQQAVVRAIKTDVERHCPKPVDYVFVTGDVSFSARTEEFAAAATWLRELAGATGLNNDRIFVVPGNHDVDRSVARILGTRHIHRAIRTLPGDIDAAISDLDTRGKLLEKLAGYITFADDFTAPGATAKGGVLDCARILGAVPGRRGPIRLVGLSSVWVSDEFDGKKEGEPTGFYPNMVLGRGPLQSLIHGSPDPEQLVFLLTHHPPEWLDQSSRNALKQALAPVPSVHLCGHVHSAAARVERLFGVAKGAIRIVAGASHAGEEETRVSHCYSWGAIRWNAEAGRWEVGWAPRTYDVEAHEICTMGHVGLDESHHVWEELGLDWDPPGATPEAGKSTKPPRRVEFSGV